MSVSRVCRWCGDSTVKGLLCPACKQKSSYYSSTVPRLFHTTATPKLLKFRNICMDMVNYREHGGEGLPGDLDYQLERANRYLADK